MTAVAPVLPVHDVPAALTRCAKLGFTARAHDVGYGYLRRDDVHLHVTYQDGLDPAMAGTSVYLYVDDADALHRAWAPASVGGRLHEPRDTNYDLREGAYVDPDGNLLRFGSWLPKV